MELNHHIKSPRVLTAQQIWLSAKSPSSQLPLPIFTGTSPTPSLGSPSVITDTSKRSSNYGTRSGLLCAMFRFRCRLSYACGQSSTLCGLLSVSAAVIVAAGILSLRWIYWQHAPHPPSLVISLITLDYWSSQGHSSLELCLGPAPVNDWLFHGSRGSRQPLPGQKQQNAIGTVEPCSNISTFYHLTSEKQIVCLPAHRSVF